MFSRFLSVAVVFLLFLSLVFSGCGKEQSPESFYIEASTDTTRASIGEIIEYQTWARGADQRQITFGNLVVDSSLIQIKKQELLLGSYSDDYGIKYTLVLWDTGLVELPPVPIQVKSADQQESFIMLPDPVFVRVESLVGANAQGGLRPIKGPVSVPFIWPLKEIGFVLAFLFLVTAAVLLWRTRLVVKKEEIKAIIPSDPADVIALRKISRMRKDEPWKRGEFKEYYFELSVLLREYVENSLFIKTLEMTTEDIRANSELLPYPSELVEQWILLLERSDLIKFAKQVPASDRCQSDLKLADEFIQKTIPYWKFSGSDEKSDSKFESPRT